MDMEFLHDLRLSLQLIQSGAEMARLALDDPGLSPADYLDIIAENVRQLRMMLDDALSVSVSGSACRLNAAACIRILCLCCQSYAVERGVTLSFSQNADAIELLTNKTLLERAALNLIMNALRVTPRGGRVSVQCKALNDLIEISVADTGPGIAPERLPYIFLPGETDGGAGFGLPSAMDCAAALGGTIAVSSHPGQGSIFTLRVPVRVALVS